MFSLLKLLKTTQLAPVKNGLSGFNAWIDINMDEQTWHTDHIKLYKINGIKVQLSGSTDMSNGYTSVFFVFHSVCSTSILWWALQHKQSKQIREAGTKLQGKWQEQRPPHTDPCFSEAY